MPISSQESKRSTICVLGVSILPLSTILISDLGIVPTVWYFFVFHVFHSILQRTMIHMGPSWPWSYGSWIYSYLCNQCLSPLMLWVRISNRARYTTQSIHDKICQWLATDRWFSPGTPVSSTSKTDRHDITKILLKVALSTIKQTNKQTKILILTLWQHF